MAQALLAGADVTLKDIPWSVFRISPTFLLSSFLVTFLILKSVLLIFVWQNATLHFTFWEFGEDMIVDRYTARTLPENCDTIWVPAEGCDVFLHPLQCCCLVLHSIVAWRFVVSRTQKSLNIHRNTARPITDTNHEIMSWETYLKSFVGKVNLNLSKLLSRMAETR